MEYPIFTLNTDEGENRVSQFLIFFERYILCLCKPLNYGCEALYNNMNIFSRLANILHDMPYLQV